MSPERLKEIRARCDKATEGPWWTHSSKTRCDEVWHGKDELLGEELADFYDSAFQHIGENNASFVAHARTDLPDCLHEIERLKEREEYLQRRIQELRKEVQRLRNREVRL